jgi:hypothetical protein
MARHLIPPIIFIIALAVLMVLAVIAASDWLH